MVLALTLLMSSLTALAAVTKPAAIPETGVVFYEDFSGYDAANPNAALTANWGYQTSASIATENGNDYASSLNGYVFGDTLFNTKTPISSGKLKISVDVRIPSTYAVGNGTYAVTYAYNWGDVFDPWNVVRTETGAAIYWANADWVNSAPKPNSEKPNKVITSEIDCDKWYNLAVVIDYSEGTRTYCLNDNLVGTSAYTGNINFLSLGLAKSVSTGYSAELDNVKIERFSETPDPEPVDENLLLSEDFEDYKFYGSQTYVRVGGSNSQDAYAKAAGDLFKSKWNNTDADLAHNGTDYMGYVNTDSTGNKYYYWGNRINYVRPTDKAVISSGKLELSFRTYIPASIPENHGVYLQMHTNTSGWFMPFIAKRTADGVSIFCGTGDNGSNDNVPDKQQGTEVKTTVGWHTLKAVFDFDERTIVYTIDDTTTVKHSENSTGVSVLYKCNLDWGFYVRMVDTETENANTVYNLIENTEIGVDDFVLRKIPTQTVNKELKIMNGASELDVAAITGTETLTVTFDAPAAVNGKKANVIIASYVGEELTGIVCDTDKTVKAGTNSFDLTINDKFEGANTVKAFIFTNFDEMYPLTDAAVYTK